MKRKKNIREYQDKKKVDNKPTIETMIRSDLPLLGQQEAYFRGDFDYSSILKSYNSNLRVTLILKIYFELNS